MFPNGKSKQHQKPKRNHNTITDDVLSEFTSSVEKILEKSGKYTYKDILDEFDIKSKAFHKSYSDNKPELCVKISISDPKIFIKAYLKKPNLEVLHATFFSAAVKSDDQMFVKIKECGEGFYQAKHYKEALVSYFCARSYTQPCNPDTAYDLIDHLHSKVLLILPYLKSNQPVSVVSFFKDFYYFNALIDMYNEYHQIITETKPKEYESELKSLAHEYSVRAECSDISKNIAFCEHEILSGCARLSDQIYATFVRPECKTIPEILIRTVKSFITQAKGTRKGFKLAEGYFSYLSKTLLDTKQFIDEDDPLNSTEKWVSHLSELFINLYSWICLSSEFNNKIVLLCFRLVSQRLEAKLTMVLEKILPEFLEKIPLGKNEADSTLRTKTTMLLRLHQSLGFTRECFSAIKEKQKNKSPLHTENNLKKPVLSEEKKRIDKLFSHFLTIEKNLLSLHSTFEKDISNYITSLKNSIDRIDKINRLVSYSQFHMKHPFFNDCKVFLSKAIPVFQKFEKYNSSNKLIVVNHKNLSEKANNKITVLSNLKELIEDFHKLLPLAKSLAIPQLDQAVRFHRSELISLKEKYTKHENRHKYTKEQNRHKFLRNAILRNISDQGIPFLPSPMPISRNGR